MMSKSLLFRRRGRRRFMVMFLVLLISFYFIIFHACQYIHNHNMLQRLEAWPGMPSFVDDTEDRDLYRWLDEHKQYPKPIYSFYPYKSVFVYLYDPDKVDTILKPIMDEFVQIYSNHLVPLLKLPSKPTVTFAALNCKLHSQRCLKLQHSDRPLVLPLIVFDSGSNFRLSEYQYPNSLKYDKASVNDILMWLHAKECEIIKLISSNVKQHVVEEWSSRPEDIEARDKDDLFYRTLCSKFKYSEYYNKTERYIYE